MAQQSQEPTPDEPGTPMVAARESDDAVAGPPDAEAAEQRTPEPEPPRHRSPRSAVGELPVRPAGAASAPVGAGPDPVVPDAGPRPADARQAAELAEALQRTRAAAEADTTYEPARTEPHGTEPARTEPSTDRERAAAQAERERTEAQALALALAKTQAEAVQRSRAAAEAVERGRAAAEAVQRSRAAAEADARERAEAAAREQAETPAKERAPAAARASREPAEARRRSERRAGPEDIRSASGHDTAPRNGDDTASRSDHDTASRSDHDTASRSDHDTAAHEPDDESFVPGLGHAPVRTRPIAGPLGRTRRPIVGLVALVLLGLVSVFFGWVSADPFWLAVGKGSGGTVTVTRCETGSAPCEGQFAGSRFTVNGVVLSGIQPADRTRGASAPARMLASDRGWAYAGPAWALHLRWGLGLLVVVLCGIALGAATGARFLRPLGRRAELGGRLLALAGPVLLFAGMLGVALL